MVIYTQTPPEGVRLSYEKKKRHKIAKNRNTFYVHTDVQTRPTGTRGFGGFRGNHVIPLNSKKRSFFSAVTRKRPTCERVFTFCEKVAKFSGIRKTCQITRARVIHVIFLLFFRGFKNLSCERASRKKPKKHQNFVKNAKMSPRIAFLPHVARGAYIISNEEAPSRPNPLPL